MQVLLLLQIQIAVLVEGDIITKIENIEISSAEEILTIINSEMFLGKEVELTINRKGQEIKSKIKPVFDEISKKYKLGLWIRDNAAGVGTLTFIRKDNMRFGALGHPVCDIDTGACLPVKSGNIFKCNIVGYRKGEKGKAGELKGLFLRNGSILGALDENNGYGVYGNFGNEALED